MLSCLIRANMANNLPPSERLSSEDVLGQISTFVIAGHETTSTSLSWTLLALALHPEAQEKLREECMSVGEFPEMDVLEGLKYLDAVVRESLRWNSIVPSSIRTCMKDDVIPLSDGSEVRCVVLLSPFSLFLLPLLRFLLSFGFLIIFLISHSSVLTSPLESKKVTVSSSQSLS